MSLHECHVRVADQRVQTENIVDDGKSLNDSVGGKAVPKYHTTIASLRSKRFRGVLCAKNPISVVLGTRAK